MNRSGYISGDSAAVDKISVSKGAKDTLEIVVSPLEYLGIEPVLEALDGKYTIHEVVLKNVAFPAGSDCECVGAKSITIGPGVTIKNGARTPSRRRR